MKTLPFSEHENIGIVADRAAERFPTASFDMAVPSRLAPTLGARISYPELVGMIVDTAAALHAAGLRHGDRVAVIQRNHFDFLILAAASARLGAVPALLSSSVTAAELPTMLGRLDPGLVVADGQRLDALGPAVFASPGRAPVLHLDGGDAGCIPLDDVRDAASRPPRLRRPDEPMVITHTSGTTGVPKLVVNSARTIANRARMQTLPVPVVSIKRSDRYAAYIGWMHARAVDGFVAFLHRGLEVLALGSGELDVVRGPLERFRPTIVEALPNAMIRWEELAETVPGAFADVRAFLSAFDAVHPRTVRTMMAASRRRSPVWFQAYGQSEAGGISIDLYRRSTVSSRRGDVTLRSMGWAMPGFSRLRITDVDTGQPLKRGRTGQIEVRSGGLSLTYLGQEDLHAARKADGWWTMGDIGYRTGSGRAVLLDRDIDRIEGFGSCLEAEDVVIDRLEDATEVVVVAGPSGQATPVVCTKGDRPLDLDRWHDAVAGLGPMAGPVHLRWDEVPRTGTLKVRRHQLRELLCERAVPAGAVPAGSVPAGSVPAGSVTGSQRPGPDHAQQASAQGDTPMPSTPGSHSTRWGEVAEISPNVDDLIRRLMPLQARIVNHPLYSHLDGLEAAQVFSSFHVYAVLDFMWLLKRLQQQLTCVEVPWLPTGDARARRFINDIVVEEESDEIDGEVTSHFELYLRGMGELGADTTTIDAMVKALRDGVDPTRAIALADLPAGAARFVATTWDIVSNGDVVEVAGAFAFGRENLIPSMFSSLLDIERVVPERSRTFISYLTRHIELDGDQHTPLAFGLVTRLCGDDPARWDALEAAAKRALEARLALWDSAYERLQSQLSVAVGGA